MCTCLDELHVSTFLFPLQPFMCVLWEGQFRIILKQAVFSYTLKVPCLLQHVPRINGEIPSVDEATLDHQRLLDRYYAFLISILSSFRFFLSLSFVGASCVRFSRQDFLVKLFHYNMMPEFFSPSFLFRLQLYGLVEQKVQGDGNCQVSLFHSQHSLVDCVFLCCLMSDVTEAFLCFTL